VKEFKEKTCRACGVVFKPKAPCNLYCSFECSEPIRIEKQRRASYAAWVKEAVRTGREHVVGVGKGGSNPKYKDHPQYKTGISQFAKLRPVVKERRYCERCSKDLEFVGSFEWCVHHRDHDRTNNEIENLELLCKRCHQIEHECWKAFEGATTIPQGSRGKCPEAPSPSDKEGEDIV
jgi:hypothetical protein